MGTLRRAACALFVGMCPVSTAAAHTGDGTGLSFGWPAQGSVTSPYGQDGGRWHPGIDIGVLRSLEVTAAAAGIVVAVGEPPHYSGYGEIVAVDVGSGLTTLYAHLAQPLVGMGQPVWAGERIGIAGCTGWCTGTHLQFELRENGAAVDPTALLP
ncbi:MAG: murein hydrolase activator EnvC [Gaiellaceae bacterium]